MDEFKINHIKNIIRRGVDEPLVNKIVDNNLEIFEAVFTSKDYDPINNYEFFEQLGDLSINKFIVMYMGRKFPQLRNSKGVEILAKFRIHYGSKNVLSQLCQKLELDKFVIMTTKDIKQNIKTILEDIFEAFFGAIEFIVDNNVCVGLGFVAVYNILKSIFDDININIDYENITNAKTILNELEREKGLSIKIKTDNLIDHFFSQVFVNGKLAGSASAVYKKDAETKAAENALVYLKSMGITKKVPEIFLNLGEKIWY